ncbi:mannose-6-phosphate isomerase, class I [Bifidobacterium sp. ESL0798]|uniref:mannose-6-phosphate isomerase, class I n=1 Tax=Bifidobacterium sp. ESL0798 TaxID=2983235 RepID=UPI0023F89C28|nr:mannose-6-phosphate isomerase, class I [Bifidobacterium sp. ESL0798]WEV74456.1 mannose-6-phosphate isomerase, class I [Bifidobacterium sp. ESL0798]
MYSIHPVVKRYAWGSYTRLQTMFASQLTAQAESSSLAEGVGKSSEGEERFSSGVIQKSQTESSTDRGEIAFADMPSTRGPVASAADAPIAEMWFSGHAQWPSQVDLDLRQADGELSKDKRHKWNRALARLHHSRVPGHAESGNLDVSMALTDLIRADPEDMLGARCSDKFGPVLPYLLKVISARIPLSLQVHPIDFQARAGFNAENAYHVPMDAPERSFKDAVAKNEMVVALEPFEASVGFATPAFMLSNLTLVDHPLAGRMVEALTPQAHHGMHVVDGMYGMFNVLAQNQEPTDEDFAQADALMPIASAVWQPSHKRIFRAFYTAVAAGHVEGLRKALQKAASEVSDERSQLAFHHALAAEEAFPGDPSVLALLMMNPLELQEGESVFIPAGTPHAYIHGTGVEIMTNSDNVLRAGMTVKHKDIPDFLQSLDCVSSLPVDPSVSWMADWGAMFGDRVIYRPKIDEFMLSYGRVGAGQHPWEMMERLSRRYGRLMTKVSLNNRHFGPRIVVCVEGAVKVVCSRESRILHQGEAVFVPAADGRVQLESDGEAGTFIMASTQV